VVGFFHRLFHLFHLRQPGKWPAEAGLEFGLKLPYLLDVYDVFHRGAILANILPAYEDGDDDEDQRTRRKTCEIKYDRKEQCNDYGSGIDRRDANLALHSPPLIKGDRFLQPRVVFALLR
jgi:hypothetical protein